MGFVNVKKSAKHWGKFEILRQNCPSRLQLKHLQTKTFAAGTGA